MTREKTLKAHARFSSSVLSDLPLPIPPPVIPEGHVPRYLRSTHGNRCRGAPKEETIFSFVRIGDNNVPNMQHQTHIPPRCGSREMKRPPSRSRHILSPPSRCPRNAVPFSFNYFGESDHILGCFSELVPISLPGRTRKRSPEYIESPVRELPELPRIGFVPPSYGSPHFAPASSPRSSGMSEDPNL
jgi:hypothetical protein